MRVLIVLLFSLATIVVKAHTSSFFISGDTIRIIDTNTQIVNKNSHYVLKIKDLFPDLFFYNSAGTKVYSDSIFNKGRSVIFAVGSYTCPLFRNSLKQLNKYLDSQKTQSDIYFVYVQEAHPIKGSPYGEAHDNIELNKRENISIHQQKNIEDRISFAAKTMNDFKVNADLLIDNENNDFFHKVFSGPTGTLFFSSSGVLIGVKEIRGAPIK